MKLGCGYPMGPLQLVDFSGLDTFHSVMKGNFGLFNFNVNPEPILILDWNKQFPENTLFEPSNLLDKKVAEGKFGIKSGEGFYNYPKK